MNIVSGVGALLAVIGAVLLVAAGFSTGEAREGFLIAGITTLPMGVIFYGVGRRVGKFSGLSPRLLDTGIPTRGLVQKMWETGVTINNNPVLGFEIQVAPDRGEPYVATVQQAIPRMLVGAVLPGSILAIETDPDDQERIAVDWSVAPEAPAVAATAETAGPAPLPDRTVSVEDLLARGRRGKATITSMRRMGRIGDLGLAGAGDPRFDDELFLVELDVKLAGRDPMPARVLHRVPDDLVGKVGPGLVVQVAVDRERPAEEVAIDWEATRR